MDNRQEEFALNKILPTIVSKILFSNIAYFLEATGMTRILARKATESKSFAARPPPAIQILRFLRLFLPDILCHPVGAKNNIEHFV